MRRWSVLLAASILSAVPAAAHAQGGLGIKAGASFGNVSNRGVLPGDLGGRTGYAGGISLGTRGGLLGFTVEALYAQRGVTSQNGIDTDSRKLDYLDVPVFLRVAIPTPGIRPFGYAGPQVSFEVRCRAGGTDCPDTGPDGTKRDKSTYAGVIGAGVRLGGASGFTIEGRYIYGLTDLKLSTVTSSESYKTRSFLILAGFSF